MSRPKNFPVSEISTEPFGDSAEHRKAMLAAGWLPIGQVMSRRSRRGRVIVAETAHASRAQVGDRVLVSLDNGHEAWADIKHIYKNGKRRVWEDGGDRYSHNRSPMHLWVR